MNALKYTLAELNLDDIIVNDPTALADLLHACATEGCFFLNLRNDHGNASSSGLLDKANKLFEVASSFFALPLSEKLQWEMDKWGNLNIGGYKPIGKHSGVGHETRDGFENFLVPLDGLMRPDTVRMDWPEPFKENMQLLKDFELECHGIGRLILQALSRVTPLHLDTPFEHLHREGQLSTSTLAMLQYPVSEVLDQKHMGHMAHTDVGSLTLLFTSSPGLEIYSENEQWIPICPGQSSVVVNVGDALRFISKQQLKSCLHRVTPNVRRGASPGPRLSMAFFLRPELEARLVDDEGREWSGEEWHCRKYQIFRASDTEQERSALLTGHKGFLGKWSSAKDVP